MGRRVMWLAISLAALLAIAGPAHAARTVTEPYGIGSRSVSTWTVPFPTLPGEGHVEITVLDDRGAVPYITVEQENNNNFGSGCGSVSHFPIIGGGGDVIVQVYPAHVALSFCGNSMALGGRVRANFYA